MERREFEFQLYSGSSLLQEAFLSGGVCGLGGGGGKGCGREACRQVLKVMLHGTICNDDFSVTQRCNVGTMLEQFETTSQQRCNAVLR